MSAFLNKPQCKQISACTIAEKVCEGSPQDILSTKK
jgi:hypothetical protein